MLDKTSSVTTDGKDGNFDVVITKTDTLAMKVRDYVFAVERQDPGAEEELTKGKLTVEYDVVNPK